MKITLLLFKPSGRQKEIPLRVPVAIVGRSRRCHLQLVDTRVSRRHCVLAVSGGKLRVTDLDSTTGTYVNDKRIRRATLKHGDMLCVGRFRLKVVMEAASRDAGAREGAGPRAEGGYVPSRKLASSPADEHHEPAVAAAAAGAEEVHDQQKSAELSAEDTVHFDSQYADERPAGEEAIEHEGGDRDAEEAQEEHHQDLEEAIAAGLEEEGQEPIHTERLDPAGVHSGSVATEEPMESATPTGAQGPGKRPRRADKRPRAIVPAASTPVPAQDQGIFADEPLGPAAGPDPATAAKPFSLAILLRFKWTVLIVFVLIAGPSIAAIWTLMRPRYTARGVVHVKPSVPWKFFPDAGNVRFARYEQYMNTQVTMILNPTVLRRALDRADVRGTEWYRKAQTGLLAKITSPPSRLEKLVEDLAVAPRGQTELIDVRMTAMKSSDAAIIANAILDEYLKFSTEKLDEDEQRLHRQRASECAALKNEIDGRERIVAKLRKELGTNDPDGLITQMVVRVDGMQAQLRNAERELALADLTVRQLEQQERLKRARAEVTRLQKALKERLTKAKDEEPRKSAQTTARGVPRAINRERYERDFTWRGLERARIEADQEFDAARQRLGPKHPEWIRLKKVAEAAEARVRARETELDKVQREGGAQIPGAAETALANPDLAALIRRLEAAQRRLEPLLTELVDASSNAKLRERRTELLKRDLEEEQASFKRKFDAAETLKRELETLGHRKLLFAEMRDRLIKTEMERGRPATIDVPARALSPTSPSSDRRIIFTALATALALGVGAALGFYRGLTSKAIYAVDDLPQLLRAPFLGQLPLIRAKRDVRPDDHPIFSEGMRMVRTAMLSRIAGQRGAAVLVTSAGMGAGKSTVAASLAKSLAQAGKDVLLVDADMRNPRLAKLFGIEPEPGLIALLTQHAADSRTIVETDTPRLSVLPSGKPGGIADLELASNGAFSACLERWRREYEVIILDSPPLLPVADARILSRHTDGTIMVVREESCDRQEIMDALAYLGSAGGKLLGTVLIGSGRRGGYEGYYHHYSYGEDKD